MNYRRLLPFALLILLILIVYFSNIHQQLTIENLRNKHRALENFIHIHPLISPLIFVALYTLSVYLIIPDSTLLTLFAGMSFAWPLAILYCIISETLGALLFFGSVKFVGKTLSSHEARFFKKMRRAFQENGASYLLFLRISHFFPFWLISFFAAYFNVTWRTFVWTTFVGTLPLVYFLVQLLSFRCD